MIRRDARAVPARPLVDADAGFARDCAQILRLSFFRTLATEPRWPLFHRVVRGLEVRGGLVPGATVADVFGPVHDLLVTRGGNAYTVAVAYFALLQQELGEALLYAAAEPSCLPDAVGDYLVVTRARARLVEIKSGRDSLARLPRQIAAYQGTASDVDVVVDAAHLAAVSALLPPAVGLVGVGPQARRVRTPALGTRMWQSLPIAYLASGGARHARAFAARARAEAGRSIDCGLVPVDLPVDQLPAAALHAALVESLAERRGEFPLAADRTDLPCVLWPIALSLRGTARDRVRILAALGQRAARGRRA